ncbi:Ubiquitin thioesterase otubain-like [Dendrobium catenatum]|uniref:Ubiquitin thioesterase otubain-like n=1 Tax=Dendrobium catenatum TaxID=906689 RepID=A0A2I0WV91_9ASPA|nr:Ubiquitin thioesterase otubain-like [Dendrobium catenatum]
MVTSNEICKRQNHFEQSIQGLSCDNAMTVQKFCEIEVEPMDKDVDNVQIIALVDALGVPIRIEYLQDSASPLEEPYITLLYRPGHYDILYTKEYHVVVPEARVSRKYTNFFISCDVSCVLIFWTSA